MPKLTKYQEMAVNSEGNVIVSAGAGSGKTKVLTERVMRKIKEGVKIDEFLILTFTNAAAKEMRDRIKVALNEANNLEEMNKVDSAHIETFDAYALYVVKKYGFKIGLPSSINNVPEDVIQVKIKSEINNIFNGYYEKDDETFKEFIHEYCTKSDDFIADFVFNFYVYATKQLDFDEFLNTYESKYISNERLEEDLNNFYKFYKDKVETIKQKMDQLDNDKTIEKYKVYFGPILLDEGRKEFFKNLKHLKTGNNGKAPVLPRKSKNDSVNDLSIKQEISELRDDLKDIDFNEDYYYKYDVKNLQKYIPLVIQICKSIRERILNFEKNKGYFTFEDIAHLAYKIVKENNEIREEIKSQIKLIFVDEYQDNSDLQNEFLSLIENNNLFCVGDVKQSIYLFRGANPSNFMKKYEKYKALDGGTAIELNDNFRSRKEVVYKINDIFAKIMTNNYGGADYAVNHIINPKNGDYESVGKIDGEHGIVILHGDSDKKSGLTYGDMIIADIKKRIASHQKVYDRDERRVRDITYKDFAILSATAEGIFQELEQELSNANLPVNAIYNEKLLEDPSILVVLSILKCARLIANGLNQDNIADFRHYYVSIVRSFLCRYDDNKIYHLIIDELYKDDEIFIKLKNFAYLHKDSSLIETYEDALNEFDVIDNLKYLINPLSYVEKLRVFDEKIRSMNDLNYELDDFIDYLEVLKRSNVEMEVKHDAYSNNSITLTTIHKSKGLEYKIVYLINLKDQNKKRDTYLINDSYCVSLPSIACGDKRPIQEKLSQIEIQSKFFEEKMRLLYVALTRAEDTCVLVDRDNVLLSGKFVDIKNINGVGGYLAEEICHTDFDESIYASMSLPEENETPKKENKWINDFKIEEKLNLSFEKGKIKSTASKDLGYDVDPKLLQKGTHMHLLMEEVDFKTKDTSFIKDKWERNHINKVLNCEIFKNVKNAKIYKEYQFIDLIHGRNGVIDLLLVFDENAFVVDYKLKHIDDSAYMNQLKVYKDFVESYMKKPCKCYLLSLLDADLKEVIINE